MFIDKKSFIKCITFENVDIKKVISTIEQGGLRIALIICNYNKSDHIKVPNYAMNYWVNCS